MPPEERPNWKAHLGGATCGGQSQVSGSRATSTPSHPLALSLQTWAPSPQARQSAPGSCTQLLRELLAHSAPDRCCRSCRLGQGRAGASRGGIRGGDSSMGGVWALGAERGQREDRVSDLVGSEPGDKQGGQGLAFIAASRTPSGGLFLSSMSPTRMLLLHTTLPHEAARGNT